MFYKMLLELMKIADRIEVLCVLHAIFLTVVYIMH